MKSGVAMVAVTFMILLTSGRAANLSETNTRIGVIGIVCDQTNGLPIPNAFVGIRRHEKEYMDRTNKDGLYCIFVPSDTRDFEVVYKATGFQGDGSPPRRNDQNPIKMEKRCLEKENADNMGQLERIEQMVNAEYALYQSSNSPEFKELIRLGLSKYHDSIQVPISVPTYLNEQERKVKLNAKAVIEDALFRMEAPKKRPER